MRMNRSELSMNVRISQSEYACRRVPGEVSRGETQPR
jgi:hypothetical protein